MITIDRFKRVFDIKPLTILSTGITIWTSTTFSQGQNWDMTLEAIVGDMYITTKSTAPTSTNAFKLVEGDVLDIKVEDYISMLGDSTTAAVQAIIWEK
jgi:hypothetical protein